MSARTRNLVLLLVLVGFIASFVTGFGSALVVARSGSPLVNGFLSGDTNVPAIASQNTPPELKGKFDVFWEAWKLVEDEFYGRPVDENKMVYGAAKGMMESLGDDYTMFVTPAENQDIQAHMEGSFQGIGVWVEMRNQKLTIVSPIAGSPAEKAGIRTGDVITMVDGKSIEGLSIEEVVAMMKGPKGTKVTISILRGDSAEPRSFQITRDEIKVPSVTSKMLDSNIAYIQVMVFGDDTTALFDAALRDAASKNAKGLILDLRSNGGGYVKTAREMLGRFLPGGVALYEDTDQGPGGETSQDVITGDIKAYDIPMVVLVNGGTASASEIVAGALQDRKRATLIGEKTFGKGSVQDVRTFTDGSSARITVAHWLTPNKRQIQGAGLTPDLAVTLTESDIQAGNDTQLTAAQSFFQKAPQ
ncbi:MAG: S41 family peptidase [Chloroflexi bacterium]|nr:S41 family peptidase [Chloroflexota bacterium]